MQMILWSFLALSFPNWAWLQVQHLQVLNPSFGILEQNIGYPRNFSLEYMPQSFYGFIDSEPYSYFCSDFQRQTYQVSPWNLLKAAPGSIICPSYIPESHPKTGFVRWYGFPTLSPQDYRTFSDISSFYKDHRGHILKTPLYPWDTRNACPNAFQIPWDVTSYGVYTIYWIWNTTLSVGDGFLVYTSCIDIELVPAIPLNPSAPSKGTSQAVSEPSSTFQIPCSSSEIRSTSAPSTTATAFLGTTSSSAATGQPSSTLLRTSTSRYPVWTTSSTFDKSTLTTTITRAVTSRCPHSTSAHQSSVGSTTHSVEIFPDARISSRNFLNASIGDTILFFSHNVSFTLYNVTLDNLWRRQEEIGKVGATNMLYQVNNSLPSWLLAIQSNKSPCHLATHFALNPGKLWKQFLPKAQEYSFICVDRLTTTLPPLPPPTVTSYTVVHTTLSDNE
ncbi:uncharacterized protein BDW43DRAFT_256058 [Aspergillus alliaceus]|uniref:uncharacterized protein n=1 Tax=Petromyces alliaceus TaxID=209559 RepID=UPI0012A5157F|nr:uncharacterized protein BDW43DRAFT_256058 [Aspergillus alliaceus]KAB8227267.1 hypothetical protein BDW43DRAFT_256058 [Aspergillus alliaceus]